MTHRRTLTRLGALSIALVAFFGLAADSCDSDHNSPQAKAGRTEAKVVGESNERINKSQPLHEYGASQIKSTLQDVEDMQVSTLQGTAFNFLEGIGLVDSCPTIGTPVPATDELTNPLQSIHGNIVAQSDPTGVYVGNSSGTWVECAGADGKAYYTLWEGYVKWVSGPAHYDTATHRVVLDGPSSYKPNDANGLTGK